MRKFIKLSVVFLLPLISLLIACEFRLRHISNDYSYKKNYLDKNSNEIEVLCLGSSHAYYGFNPAYCSHNSFNAAHSSQSLNYDLAIIEKYKNRWSSLKFIIIPIDYFSMYSSLENDIEKWRAKNYAIYYGINPGHNYKYEFELLNGKFSDNIERLRLSFSGKSDITCNKWGWGVQYHSRFPGDLSESGRRAARRHSFNIVDNPDFARNIKVLNCLIDFANKKNIRILFVTYPAFSSYVQNLNPKQLSRSIEAISHLTFKNEHAAYYNFLSDSAFHEEDFYDGDHLNEKGAEKFTRLMDSLIKTQ